MIEQAPAAWPPTDRPDRIRIGTGAVAAAFVRLGAVSISAYPLSFAVSQIGALVPIVVYAFVGHLVTGSAVGLGGTWFSFVVVGVVVVRVLSGPVVGLGEELDDAMREGRLEILLTTPVSARSLPVFLAVWPTIVRAATGAIVLAVGLSLGAHLDLAGVPVALAFLGLGVVAALGLGLAAISVQMLVKRSGPLQEIHGMAVATLAGAFFPTHLLPTSLHWLSWALPETWVLIGVRRALLIDPGAIDGPSSPVVFAVVALFAAVLCPLGLWMYGRALRTARTSGLLSGY